MTGQQDTSHGMQSPGEMPYSGRGPQAGVSTPSETQPAGNPGSQPPPDAVATSRFPGQDVGPSLAEDDDNMSSPESPSSHHHRPTLLNLPLEIRLEIYTHLLTTPAPFPTHSPLPPPPSSTPSSSSPPAPFFAPQTAPIPLHPSILRACRQLHAECTPVLYRSNTFLAHTSLLTVFPSFFSPSHPRKAYAPVRSPSLASLVTRFRVRVRLDAEPQFARDQATAQFSGKSELVIEAWQAEWRGAGPDVLRLFEGIRGVRAARVTGSTSGFEDYARWLERAMMAGVGDSVAPFPWEDGFVKGTFRV